MLKKPTESYINLLTHDNIPLNNITYTTISKREASRGYIAGLQTF